MVLKWGGNLSGIFWAFIVLNIILGAFISATSAKTALLLPLFMVISAVYGAFGGTLRNNVGRNLVLQNLLANNVSASAFITGSAANLLAAKLLEKAGHKVFYAEWLMALLPLAVIQCAIACAPTEVYVLSRDKFTLIADGHKKLTFNLSTAIARTLAMRFRRTERKLTQLQY